VISALANHLWQSTLFAAAVWLLTLALRNNRAAVRHAVWLAASIKFLIPFSLLVSLGAQLGWRAASVAYHAPVANALNEIVRPFTAAAGISPAAPAPPTPDRLPSILFGVWSCGFVFGLIAWARALRQLRTALRGGDPLHLGLPIPAMSCAARMEPGVFGIRKPVLLLPEGITDRLTPAQFDAIIAHELCHVGRKDNLTAAIHLAVETAFWFHPLMWWIRARLVEEREQACDEAVLKVADPDIYAQGILNVCRYYVGPLPACAAGITGADLTRRVKRIIGNSRSQALGPAKRLFLVTAALAAIAGPFATGLLCGRPARAQNAAAREFEAVSVKLDSQKGPQWVSSWKADPTMLRVMGYSLAALVEDAYNLKPYQVLWKHPTRIESERFELQARTAKPATEAEMMRMLQPVLAERFHLVFHRETRRMPVLFLQNTHGGPRLESASTSEGPNLDMRKDYITALHLAMDDFADVLGQFVTDRPVLNRTGLRGEYRFHLTFAPSDDATGGQTIFSALSEQLGLKLEAGKAPVEVMVIDRAERPSDN
jgi:bla regulator protein blaR1